MFMEKDLTIQKIHSVFEGEFNPGHLENTKGRHSDAFVIYLYGRAEYVIGERSFCVGSGGVFFLAKGSQYQINVFEKSKFVCIDFDFCQCEQIRESCLFDRISPSVKNDFLKLFHVWHSNDSSNIPQAFSILYNVYFEGIRALDGSYSRSGELFSRITSYILDNYTNPDLSLEHISIFAGISEVHIRRIFKDKANTTPIKYINFIRITQAENMMKNSNFTVAEIAEAVGFNDPFYFSRIFKKSYGLSPREFSNTIK